MLTNAVREALDEFMNNYVNPACEHISDGQWNEIDEAGYEIFKDLVIHGFNKCRDKAVIACKDALPDLERMRQILMIVAEGDPDTPYFLMRINDRIEEIKEVLDGEKNATY